MRRFETTPGRARLGGLLPLNTKAPFDLVNRLLRKKEVQQVIDTVYRYCGQKESVIFCDQIMSMGFSENGSKRAALALTPRRQRSVARRRRSHAPPCAQASPLQRSQRPRAIATASMSPVLGGVAV